MKKKRKGRPSVSLIRQNIIEILFNVTCAHPYEIYKLYKQIFPGVSQRSIYYQLRRGVETGEFVIKEVKEVNSNYSWGRSAMRIYYKLGPKAKPKLPARVVKFFSLKNKKTNKN